MWSRAHLLTASHHMQKHFMTKVNKRTIFSLEGYTFITRGREYSFVLLIIEFVVQVIVAM